jgi:hypothetical protein
MKWLIDETRKIDAATLRELQSAGRGRVQLRAAPQADLAVRLKEVVIHDTGKWFGGAEIRLDTLVVHGAGAKAKKDGFYQPTTHRFARVVDGERLPIGEEGLLLFYGQPRHFLDLSITASRDRKDSEDLAALVDKGFTSPDFTSAAADILELTSLSPQAGAIAAAVKAAATLGTLAAQLLLKATSNTIGLYRNSFLQARDAFGIGRHPAKGSYRNKDFSFSYEIVVDRKAPARRA